jgi:hypothetical protein
MDGGSPEAATEIDNPRDNSPIRFQKLILVEQQRVALQVPAIPPGYGLGWNSTFGTLRERREHPFCTSSAATGYGYWVVGYA